MVDLLSITISAFARTISVLREDGRTERFALGRSADGDVYWRQDLFGPRDVVTGETPWLRHGGRVSVAALVARLPRCAARVAEWTREELEEGPDLHDLAFHQRATRGRALERLAAELAALPADAA